MNFLLIYGYGYPDENVSSQHFSDLAKEIRDQGHNVKYWCLDRGYRNFREKFKSNENHEGVEFRRVSSSRIKNSFVRKCLNLFLFNCAIFWRLIMLTKSNKYHYLITGTDPIFSHCVVSTYCAIRKEAPKHIHWYLDLYPEAFESAGLLKKTNIIYRFFDRVSEFSYSKTEAIFCLDDAMVSKFNAKWHYKCHKLYPWSLTENDCIRFDDEQVTALRKLNKPRNQTSILMSGNFGLAHDSFAIYEFMKACSSQPKLKLTVSIGGNRSESMYNFLKGNATRFDQRPYVEQNKLVFHLSSYDVHLVVIKSGWDGVVMPSKFLGALQVGKPVVYVGPQETLISEWIEKYKIGWDYLRSPQQTLRELATLSETDRLAYYLKCRAVYTKHSNKKTQVKKNFKINQMICTSKGYKYDTLTHIRCT